MKFFVVRKNLLTSLIRLDPPLIIEGRINTALFTNAFNNDLTDCVEVFTPAGVFGHLGNGEGLFRSAKMLKPYLSKGQELTPLMMKAVMEGLEEFQNKLAEECDFQCNDGPKR